GVAFIFYRGQRDRLGRRLPARARTGVGADVDLYGARVSGRFRTAMGEWALDLGPESVWPASPDYGTEPGMAEVAIANAAPAASSRASLLWRTRTVTTAAAVFLAAG